MSRFTQKKCILSLLLAVVVAAIVFLCARSINHFIVWQDMRSKFSSQISNRVISTEMPLGFIIKEFDIDAKKMFASRLSKPDRGRSLELYCTRLQLDCEEVVEQLYEHIRQ